MKVGVLVGFRLWCDKLEVLVDVFEKNASDLNVIDDLIHSIV